MITLEVDDETATVLNTLAEQKHINPAQLLKNVLFEYLEEWQDAQAADKALMELERGDDTVISLVELERQLDAMDD